MRKITSQPLRKMTGRSAPISRPGQRANLNLASMNQLEKRTQLIRLRIESLERRKLVLKSYEKWPTIKSVRRYQEQKNSSPPAETQSATSPAASQPNLTIAVETRPNYKSDDTKNPPLKLPAFPFPISKANDTPFTQFSNLPPE